MVTKPIQSEFTEFIQGHGPGLRHAFISRYGPDVGSDVMGDVSLYAWEHWDEVAMMDNPSGWLYRVGQSRSRRYFRRSGRFPERNPERSPMVEPALPDLIESLPDRQRVAVLLTHAFGYTVREAADIIGVSPSTVHQNAERGVTRLRKRLGVSGAA